MSISLFIPSTWISWNCSVASTLVLWWEFSQLSISNAMIRREREMKFFVIALKFVRSNEKSAHHRWLISTVFALSPSPCCCPSWPYQRNETLGDRKESSTNVSIRGNDWIGEDLKCSMLISIVLIFVEKDYQSCWRTNKWSFLLNVCFVSAKQSPREIWLRIREESSRLISRETRTNAFASFKPSVIH